MTSAVAETIQAAGIPMTRIGTTGGTTVAGPGFSVDITDLREANEAFFKDWMEG